ncbi:MAG: CBS domain-containing protein [Methanosarcinaceae archaeon]|nr:CBS domain-containing protein [Methanosarcinaceae archaeon]
MKIEDIMSSPVYVITPDEPVSHARKLMLKHKVSSIVVVDDDKIVGIVTKSDLVKRLAQAEPIWRRRPIDKVPINLIMTELPVITIYPGASIKQAVDLMLENNINNLPVIKNSVIGIVTKKDIVRYISEQSLDTKVSDSMGECFISVHRHHTINHIIDEMERNEVNKVIVIDDAEEAVGIISTTNLALSTMTDYEGKLLTKSIKMARRPNPGGEKTYRYIKEVPLVAEDIMSGPVVTINSNDTVVNAAKIMIKENITALPVEQDDAIVGMISRTDVIKAIDKLD